MASSPANNSSSNNNNKAIGISLADWQNRLNDVNVSKGDLNRLVMDYLVVEGYKEAAENFARESGMLSDSSNNVMDFESIHNRMVIRNAIQSGDIVDAIERVNDFDPEILDNNPALYFQLQQQRLIELIRQKKIEEALIFAQEELAPRGEEHPEFLNDLESTMTLLAYDVDLAAIEAKYRASTSPAAGGAASSSSAIPATNGEAAANEDGSKSAYDDDNIDGIPSSIIQLLHPAHRQSTATKVNSAILKSQSHGSVPKLPNLLKMLSWGEELLAVNHKVDFPRMDILVNNPRENAATAPTTEGNGSNTGLAGDVAML
ncbi:hypothetical protein P389DRAFT_169877 [Cystobasidium minutum MCA 4210]|uniref:uncharacterized protein n=1 Tax=Cystobasidium minutum MCA 4210 TaxID=1397322 RepID=UPI0034CD2F1B|eukprot:jgi/Rhomi1/169877/fgenesh1_kg.3_\